ncbi:prophage tail fiber N-terminal domain-containing protein [Yersinia alsatica]|uniref:prophage tail fiber N-terminal domain-containing protein n=1 Tax=Yersinia alsatica TaxID=2890317 RepID=UPI00119E079A|nr:prophage tail fiber N-terminal domain-containing protein [Yersinia alsatica]
MSIKISGILPGPTGEPAAHIGITLRAVKTSLTVVATLESNSITGVDGSYSLNVEPGQYDVLLWVDGINARNVGRITVYSDSLPGTLNNFLTALREEDGTPEIIRQLEQLRADALQAALEAKQSKDEAIHQAEIATAAAGNAAQETADLITATVKGDADRAEAAREGAETAQSAVNALTDEVIHYHTEVGQLALASEGSAAAAAQSSNSAEQSASESESSKNAAAQSEQMALASAESAENSATAAAGDKSAANSFRNEAEQFAVQAKASAESIDVSALELQINEKVSQTVFDEAIAGKASNEALAEGLADKMDIAGGVFEGPVQLHGDAIEPLEAVTKQQLDNHGGLPIGFVSWSTNRNKIRAGEGPLDGQLLSRALFHDFFASLVAGDHPIISDAAWLADPYKRASFTLGDGVTTFRLADLNGKSAGSIGRVFLSGDGVNSNGVVGTIQATDNKAHNHGITDPGHQHVKASQFGAAGTSFPDSTIWAKVQTGDGGGASYTDVKVTGITINSSGSVESRPNNATGCYTIKLAGVALNAGQIDALELATQLVTLSTRVTALESKKITYLYPGGTEAAPASISANQRIIVANPFPNDDIACIAEVKWEGNWGTSRWWYNATSNDARGTNADVLTSASAVQSIIVQSGSGTPLHRTASYTGSPLINTAAGDPSSVPFRVKVWRIN